MTPKIPRKRIDHPKAILFCKAILDRFQKNNIDYALLRNYQSLPDVIVGDLDFLILPAQLPSVKALVTSLERDLSIHPFFTSENRPHFQKFYLCEGEENVILQLDFHSYLGRRGFQYAAAHTFLERKHDSGAFFVLDEQDRMAMYLFHCLFDKKEFWAVYTAELKTLLSAYKDVDFLKVVLPDRLYRRVMTALNQNRFQELFRLRRPIRLALIRHYPRNLIQPFLVRIRWGIKRMPSLLKPIGTHAAFIGPDGSGKTSIINALYREFKKYALPGVKKVDMGLRKQGILPLEWLNAASPKHSFFKNMWLALGLIDVYLRYAIRIYPSLVKGKIVLSDRYVYDLFAGRFQIAKKSFLQNMVFRFTPDPDICFIVKRDPLAIKASRDELDVAVIRRYYRTLDDLKREFFHEIMNDDLNDSKNACMAQIIARFKHAIPTTFSASREGKGNSHQKDRFG